jgi:hypothetical protein
MPLLPGHLLYQTRFKIVAMMTMLMSSTSRTTMQALKRKTGQYTINNIQTQKERLLYILLSSDINSVGTLNQKSCHSKTQPK